MRYSAQQRFLSYPNHNIRQYRAQFAKVGGSFICLTTIRIVHVNALAFQAVLFGYYGFFTDLRAKHIRVQPDHVAAVMYVNDSGGVDLWTLLGLMTV